MRSFSVISGGPGSGKSTLIAALGRAGFRTSSEVGRRIIQEQVAISGRALPWVDPVLFAEMMLSWEIRAFHDHAARAGRVFFDRGVPDVIGYLRLQGLPVPAHMEKAAALFRYARRVFLCPPWPEIFTRDEERKQSLEEAERTYASMVMTYSACGYELLDVPRGTVEERVAFILGRGAGASA
ncbi:AAA family ATPase [Chondromyces crocatus]|uniref:ATPase n=1 Tax=Chondromyces crocatus TaxID=52 RepID=A0A0K1EPB5_CHOCO|nr:AAA family ATPase [Chondromyces crocatus]AKT42463.1 ATPase [Chondromyces crocatus]